MPRNAGIVGLDVSKAKLDGSIRSLGERRSVANTAEGRAALVAWLRASGITTAVMEASGGYEQVWSEALREAGIAVRIVDPKRVRAFAISAGRLAKNDPIDAEMIAWFAETFADQPRQEGYDPARQELAKLVTAREALKQAKTDIGNRNEHRLPRAVEKAFAAVMRTIAAELAKLEAAITAKIAATERFAADAEIIDSMPGLAMHTVAGLVAWMPELGHIGSKAAAALLGSAPFDDDSGRHRGERHIRGGRKELRALLYMAIVGAATQHNPVLKAFYERLIARGKRGKVAIIACMRKLIVILNTMLARREKWNASRYREAQESTAGAPA
jgi:transposase